MTGFFGNFQLDFGGQPSVASQGDDMAVKSRTITLAEINAAATPSGTIAALSFDVTDVVDLTTAGFKTDIDAATDTAAQNALRLLLNQPWENFGGTTITIAGTSGYNGVHEIASNGVVASGGKLTFKTNTALGGTEAGVTATAVFTKLACFGFQLPVLPATSMLIGYDVVSLGSAAGGVTQARALTSYLRPDGSISSLASGLNLVTTDGAEFNSMNAGRTAASTGHGPLDRTALWLIINANQEAGKQLDDITGLDGGVIAIVAYIEVPALA